MTWFVLNHGHPKTRIFVQKTRVDTVAREIEFSLFIYDMQQRFEGNFCVVLPNNGIKPIAMDSVTVTVRFVSSFCPDARV